MSEKSMTLNPKCSPPRTRRRCSVDHGVWKGISLIELYRRGLITDNKSKPVENLNQNEASSNSNLDEKVLCALQPVLKDVNEGGCGSEDTSIVGESSGFKGSASNLIKLGDKLQPRAASAPVVSIEHAEALRAIGRELRMIADEFTKSASLRIPIRRRCQSLIEPKPSRCL